MYGIDKKIKFNHKVNAANWSTKDKGWTLDITADGSTHKTFRSQFVMFCTGYYDYERPLATVIPGIEGYKGKVVHPQFWPEDLDYTDKTMAIIGSGATAVTLLPILASKAKHVTMVQRSPSYLLSIPKQDGLERFITANFPTFVADKLVRAKWLVGPLLFVTLCVRAPEMMKRVIKKQTEAQLPPEIKHDPHFKPTYNPFEQRLCFCPDGDFYKSLRNGNASIETGHIETVTADTIKMQSGAELHPDIIVTATGLKLQMAGGINLSVDGKPYNVGEKYMWKGVMLEDLPNSAYVVGYVDASWTLGAGQYSSTFPSFITSEADNPF